MLENGDATISIVGPPSAGIVRIAVPNEKTATLPAGVYFDALQVSFGEVSPLWVGQIFVAANPLEI